MAELTTTLTTQQLHALTLRQRIAFAVFRGLLHLTALLPLKAARPIGRYLGHLYYNVAKKRVHIARVNIEICFPGLPEAQREALVKKSLAEAGIWFMEAGALWLWPTEKLLRYVTVKNPEVFETALAAERGVILAIPHLGNWEIMGPYLAGRAKFACFYKHDDKHNPLFSDYLRRRRSRNGTIMAPADPAGVRCLYKHLKAGNVIGLLPDHNPTAEMGVFAPFFGRPALTGTLMSTLARKNGAKVLTATAIRIDGGFEIHFADVSNQDSEDPVVAATGLNRAIERCIGLAPAQFHWVYPRFSRRLNPGREQSPYRRDK